MKTLAFDLDDVICFRSSHHEDKGVNKYYFCKPIEHMINIINNCYEDGYYIIIYTSRGMTQFEGDIDKIRENLYVITKESLDEWNVKYHEIIMGKIDFDLLIDDKAVNSYNIKSKKDIDERVK